MTFAVCAGCRCWAVDGGRHRRRFPGVGLLDLTTRRGRRRAVGRGGDWCALPGVGALTGFENHRGVTTLGAGAVPLGRVLQGTGNGTPGRGEGVLTDRVIGTYLHGPVLARNPALADALLRRVTGGTLAPLELPDQAAVRAERLARTGRRPWVGSARTSAPLNADASVPLRWGHGFCLGPRRPGRAGIGRLWLGRPPARACSEQAPAVPSRRGRAGERAHGAAGSRHRRRPQPARRSPRSCCRCSRCWASGTARGRRRAPAATIRFGQWIRFAHDGRGFLAYDSRTWKLTDDGAVVGPDVRESGFLRPGRAGRGGAAGGQPRRPARAVHGDGPDDDELGVHLRRHRPHARRAPTSSGRPALRHRRRRAAVRRSTAPAADDAAPPGDVRPTRDGSDDHTAPTPRQVADRYVEAACRPRPDPRHVAGHPARGRPAARLRPRRAWRPRRRCSARRWPSWTACWPPTRRSTPTRSSAAARACCASG